MKKYLLLSLLFLGILSNVALAQVTVTAAPPPYGWQVMTGAVRTIPFKTTGGATNKLNFSATGATLSCTSNCPNVVTATITASPGTCSVTGSVGSYGVHATSIATVTATTVDTPTQTAVVSFDVCSTTNIVDVEPAYQQAFKNQSLVLQSYVIGSTNLAVTWAITSSPSGGDGTLSDTVNRDTLFNAGTVTGRYVLTATAVVDGTTTGTAIVYVSPHTLPSYTNGVTLNKTQPRECYPDPAMTGTYYDIGAGHTYPDIKSINFQTWTAGSIACIFNTDTTGSAPSTYHNAACVRSTGNPGQPLYIGGVADSVGNLPIVDGLNATENIADTACTSTDGLGAFKMTGTNSGFSQGYGLGSVGPDYLIIAGLEIRNFQVGLPYTTSGGASATYSNPSGVWIATGQHVLMAGLDLENDGWGVLANSNTAGGGRRFTQFHQFIGGHINNFSQPGSFSMHALYMEGIHSLVEGNLIENPQFDISGVNPNYDAGDYIKMRGGDSIIRGNTFRGALGDHFVEYPDMEDTIAFMSTDGNLGVLGDTTCADSTWCSVPTNNITLAQLTENEEALANDWLYDNAMSNQLPIIGIQVGSQSAPLECGSCTNMVDRQGRIVVANNTIDQAFSALSTINYNTSGFTAVNPIFAQISVLAVNNSFWSDPTTFSGTLAFPFTLNVDATMVAQWETNLFGTGIMNLTTPITGGPGTGWGNLVTSCCSYTLAIPLDTHMTGLTSPNFLTSTPAPYNLDTLAPISGSALIGAGTSNPLAGMPCRFQPLPTGYMSLRSDNCTTIGAIQSGAQPTPVSIAITPNGKNFPAVAHVTQVFYGILTWSDSFTQQIQYRTCGWNGVSYPLIAFFAPNGCGSVGQTTTDGLTGSGTVYTDTYLGVTPTPANFTVGTVVSSPSCSPGAGTYSTTQIVSCSTTTPSASLCYTLDGSTPAATTPGTCDSGSTLYTGALSIATTQTLNVLATISGGTNSGVTSNVYTISPVVSNPTLSPGTGTYSTTTPVTITTSTSGATICYTIDGSTPAASAGSCSHGTTYTSAISVATTTTIKTIATKSGATNSNVVSATYTLGAPVVLTISGKVIFSGTVIIK